VAASLAFIPLGAIGFDNDLWLVLHLMIADAYSDEILHAARG
jgi:hypothetical protein